MKEQLIQEVKEALSKATPGPWYWHGYTKGHYVDLVTRHSGQQTVMSLSRWGMGGAAPLFRTEDGMQRIDVPGMVKYRQEHRKSEFTAINHPDAELIAAAPELLKRMVDALEEANRENERLRIIEFPRQPNRDGEWVIRPSYLELVMENMNNYHGDDAPDYCPTWEQIEMVLMAVERMRPLSPKEDKTDDQTS